MTEERLEKIRKLREMKKFGKIMKDLKPDLDKLKELLSTAPANLDDLTLEILAAQPGLLKKAASKLKWTALLEKHLTGSRNSVVVVLW